MAELARLLNLRDAGKAPCRQVRQIPEDKLIRMESQIADLEAIRNHLRGALIDCDQRRANTSEGQPARLLQTLSVPERRKKSRTLKEKTE